MTEERIALGPQIFKLQRTIRNKIGRYDINELLEVVLLTKCPRHPTVGQSRVSMTSYKTT